MIHLLNGQYWYFPAITGVELPKGTDSSCLVFSNPSASLPSNRRARKQPKLSNSQKMRTKSSRRRRRLGERGFAGALNPTVTLLIASKLENSTRNGGRHLSPQ